MICPRCQRDEWLWWNNQIWICWTCLASTQELNPNWTLEKAVTMQLFFELADQHRV